MMKADLDLHRLEVMQVAHSLLYAVCNAMIASRRVSGKYDAIGVDPIFNCIFFDKVYGNGNILHRIITSFYQCIKIF